MQKELVQTCANDRHQKMKKERYATFERVVIRMYKLVFVDEDKD